MSEISVLRIIASNVIVIGIANHADYKNELHLNKGNVAFAAFAALFSAPILFQLAIQSFQNKPSN